ADGRGEPAGAEGDEVGRRDRLDAPVGRANVVVFQVDPLDRRLAGRADVDLLLDHAPVSELGAEMRVVESHGKDATADAKEPRGLLDRAQERSLLWVRAAGDRLANGIPFSFSLFLVSNRWEEERTRARAASARTVHR